MQQLQRPSRPNKLPIADLYERYWLTILLYARQFLPSQEDAEDVLLDVFLAALQSETFFRLAEQQQLTWLRSTAHHKSVDFLRRVHRRPAVPLEEAVDLLYEDDERAPEHMALRGEEYALLQRHIADLPAQQQEVLRLRFAQDLRCAEIAVQMQKSEGAVRTLLSRTLNLLRTIYHKKSGGTL